ncbi:ABC transporter ATP-binding protein (plasmid) [Paroceanicella profunda]|uniref:ABC transporter ATP-binding protein n=1 Tax=Paroceanicella profunda TaxID=2579971 RepID=A0A5B8FYF8_9RHOB|nr:ABC transporter ATP-binding protein [Paroceanicella profunda]QDL93946.1 ABC transporter ATP-binding protein [Paroceanicella profunda]
MSLLALEAVTVLRDARPVLREVSMALGPGERLAITGGNGAGKSTLLRTLIGLERPRAGRVLAFGAERRDEAGFREVRRRVGLLFQDADDQLFSPTVLEDVAFGPLNLGLSRGAAEAVARQRLEAFGIGGLGARLTHRLSGGEKRLVALAAVLAMDPEVLLLDEPTNALDEAHAAQMAGLLDTLGCAMILVSHDASLVERLATRKLALRDGCLTSV